MTAVEFSRKKVHTFCLKLSRGFSYGFQTGLNQIKSLAVNKSGYSVLRTVVMELVEASTSAPMIIWEKCGQA